MPRCPNCGEYSLKIFHFEEGLNMYRKKVVCGSHPYGLFDQNFLECEHCHTKFRYS